VRSIGSPSWIDQLLGTAPQPVPPFAFAIDGHELRGAAFRRERSGWGLRELHSVPVAVGTLGGGALGGPVTDPEALARAASDLVSRFQSPPRRASLVLPDRWARALVVELGAFPPQGELRAEILRFRLKKLIPFRVDELRISAVPIASIRGQEDPVRTLCSYAAEGLCSELENAFGAAGVFLGQITNATLARLGATTRESPTDDLTGVATVEDDGFALVFARHGLPVAWRQKSFADGLDENERAPMLAAELRLTRTYLDQRLEGTPLSRVLLAAPGGVEAFWSSMLEDGLAAPVTPLAAADLPLAGPVDVTGLGDLAPMLGVACSEVA
jgi:type IV pilus assembly protein PilM